MPLSRPCPFQDRGDDDVKMTRDEFVRYVLDGGKGVASKKEAKAAQAVTDALPDGFETKFGAPVAPTVAAVADVGPERSFAEKLLRGCGFGEPETLDRARVILGDNPAAKYLPEKVLYWEKSLPERPYQVLLFEADKTWGDIKGDSFFRGKRFEHLDLLEDALTRLVQSALKGFEQGGEARTADVKRGRQDETLCVVSFVDDREPEAARLLCLGSYNDTTESLEAFFIRESCRFWEKQLAEEHLGALYERQFKTLMTAKWHDAFTTEAERKLAHALVKECAAGTITKVKLANRIRGLLDEIAKGFGLKPKKGEETRLTLTELPPNHDIGADPASDIGRNPFSGISVRDEKHRLLGYIVYCLDKKGDADVLSAQLKKHNRFHNVLVVYPEEDDAVFELWQGTEKLEGRLSKLGARFSGEAQVISLLSRFFVVSRAKVKDPRELADELASRAKYLRRLAHNQLEGESGKGKLRGLYNAFKEALIHDMSEDNFTDAFAQTLTYGLLTARWLSRDELVESGDRFTREAALDHLPSTSPFLREFFTKALQGGEKAIVPALLWLLDDIAELLDRVHIDQVFGKGDEGFDTSTDPVIHFYEPFLAAYNPEERQKRGVYYTPRPVVSFIVRGVDELLRTELGVEGGLASTMTWKDMLAKHPGVKKPEGVKLSDPFVCILDPATGTGTFLVMCIEVIERSVKESAATALGVQDTEAPAVIAVWQAYVIEKLLPRLYGFELMIAPYAIAHLKIGLKLQESGARLKSTDRLNVYLTNSLEPPVTFAGHLAFDVPALASEAKAVNSIKSEAKFTVVLGNPPYNSRGTNSTPWCMSLIDKYKATVRHEETQIQALSDDYIKFIGLADWHISRSHIGVIGMITNNGYMDGHIFRDVRRCLVASHSHVKILNLHGDTNKKEKTPEGYPDKNVFDIRQGVGIITLSTHSLHAGPRVLYADLWGSRESKYASLDSLLGTSPSWAPIAVSAAEKMFRPRAVATPIWEQASALAECFGTGDFNRDKTYAYGSGFKSQQDEFALAFTSEEFESNIQRLLEPGMTEVRLREAFALCKTNQWNFQRARTRLKALDWRTKIQRVLFRPYDYRYTIIQSDVVTNPRRELMAHLERPNLAILSTRKSTEGFSVFITDIPCGHKIVGNYDMTTVFPLWRYPGSEDREIQLDVGGDGRLLNLSSAFLKTLEDRLGIKVSHTGTVNIANQRLPESVVFFCYGLLHSAHYRSANADSLRVDYPRIAVPFSLDLFDAITSCGSQLASLHTMNESVFRGTQSHHTGRKETPIDLPHFKSGTIWIDRKETAGFTDVSTSTWESSIGSYQLCSKWLQDRKGRALSTADIAHYSKVLFAIAETARLASEVDRIIDQFGGWPVAFERVSV